MGPQYRPRNICWSLVGDSQKRWILIIGRAPKRGSPNFWETLNPKPNMSLYTPFISLNPKPFYHIYLNPNGIYCQTVNRVNRFIAKWSIESTDLLPNGQSILLPNGQSSQPIYCPMVNPFIAKWSIHLLPNGQSIYCQMVNPFIAKWSIHLLPNGQSIYCRMVNPFIAKWSIHVLPNGQSIYCQWSIWSGLGLRVQGLEMVRGGVGISLGSRA